MKSICPVHSEKGVSRQYLLHSLAADYETVRVMKTGPRGSVLLLQNKQNGKRLVFRRYEGSGEVYQKLLPISCPYLPQIMEVAGENGRVAVLEEYIEGDSLAELLRGARFTAAEAREITWQLCQALRVHFTSMSPVCVVYQAGPSSTVTITVGDTTSQGGSNPATSAAGGQTLPVLLWGGALVMALAVPKKRK